MITLIVIRGPRPKIGGMHEAVHKNFEKIKEF